MIIEIITLILAVAVTGLGFLLFRAEREKTRIKANFQEAREKIVSLETEKSAFDQKLKEIQNKNTDQETKIEVMNSDLAAAREKAIVFETEKISLSERLEQHKIDLGKMEERFKVHFENLAHKIFDEKNAKFKEQSQESLGEILNPLKEKLNDFQKKVDDSFGGHAKEQFALKEEIKRIVDVNEKMTFQAESLTKALKGDSKTQGNWGEVMLEKILDDSGLRKGQDYIVQGVDMKLKHPDGGRHQKPDVVVMLPEEKHIIIDSKVSLTHYERFCAETEEDVRTEYLKQFIASVKKHVLDLEQRRYQDTEKLGTPDFVLMFMPIEGAYALAIQQDQELQTFAWGKKIVIVCPSTLFATLRTVASIWRLELQNKNAIEIAKKGGDLYDKVVGFVEDMQKIGDQIKNVDKTYGNAMSKLSEGRGNIIKKTEQLKELGVKASKSLPKDMVSDDKENKTIQALK